MLCQKCKKNNATFFYTQNLNGSTYSVALCDECKKLHFTNEESSYIQSLYNNFSKESIFGSSLFPAHSVFSKQNAQKRCSVCGASFYELCQGRAFCPECYFAFKEELEKSLKNMHGSSVHKGIRPSRLNIKNDDISIKSETAEMKNENAANACPKSEIELLKEALQQAIREERYEDAAALRDSIKAKEFEKKGE